jgi:hypothetical protein
MNEKKVEDKKDKNIPDMPREIVMPFMKSPKQIDKINKAIVVLRLQSSLLDEGIEKMEEKYAEKFGCKVVILEPSLQMVEVIHG